MSLMKKFLRMLEGSNHRRRKTKPSRARGPRDGQQHNLIRVFKVGTNKKVAYEQRLRSETISHVDVWGKAFQAEDRASAKALR